MRNVTNQNLKAMLKLQKPPAEVKQSVISVWKKKHVEQRVTRVLAGGIAWFVFAGTLMTILLRRTHGT